jgi:hypothetical protein
MHTITSIIDIKPYRITVTFDGKDKRTINFESLLVDFPVLKDINVFNAAVLDDYPTIKWDGLARMRDLDGTIRPAPLDFCPDTLYTMSEAV